MSLATKLDPLLEPIIDAVRHAEQFFGPDDDWVEDDRRIAYEAAQRVLGGVHTFVYDKDDQDYLTTTTANADVVEEALNPTYQRNLISSRKRRQTEGGWQWAVGSWVLDPKNTPTQHHVYLFESPDGGCDVYAHTETSVREGAEHLTETNQQHATAGQVFDCLDRANIQYSRRQL